MKRWIPNVMGAGLVILFSGPSMAQQTTIADRLSAAMETIQGACAADINNFCSKVTRGEGRLLSCMQAYDDQLAPRCQLTLYRASRQLERSLDRVGRIADACWSDIEANCSDADKIGQCVLEKRASLSPACQSVADTLRKTLQGLAALRGLPVFGSDNSELGQVVDVKRGSDGSVQSIEIEVGQALGIGPKVVVITADQFDQLADKVRLRLGREQARNLPAQAKK